MMNQIVMLFMAFVFFAACNKDAKKEKSNIVENTTVVESAPKVEETTENQVSTSQASKEEIAKAREEARKMKEQANAEKEQVMENHTQGQVINDTQTTAGNYVKGELLVGFHSKADVDELMKTLTAEEGVELIKMLGGNKTAHIAVPKGQEELYLAKWQKLKGIRYVELNQIMTIQ